MLIFLIYLIATGKKLKHFFVANLILLILSIPILPLLAIFANVKSKLLFDYFDYYKFSTFILSSTIDSIGGPLAPRYSFLPDKIINFLVSVSVFIFFLAIIKSITRRKLVLTLFLMGLIPFLLELIFAIQGKFALLYDHTIFSVPFFIIAASCGFFEFKKKIFPLILLVIFITINLTYILFYKQSVCNIYKLDGFNVIAQKLQSLHATEQDQLILIPFGGYLGIKYNYKAKIAPLSLNDYSLNNEESFKYIFDESFIKSLNKDNVYNKLKPFMDSKQPTKIFTNFIQNDVLKKIPSGRYLYIAIINYGSLKYSKEHMIDEIRQKITNDIFYILKREGNINLINLQEIDGFSFFVFKRVK